VILRTCVLRLFAGDSPFCSKSGNGGGWGVCVFGAARAMKHRRARVRCDAALDRGDGARRGRVFVFVLIGIWLELSFRLDPGLGLSFGLRLRCGLPGCASWAREAGEGDLGNVNEPGTLLFLEGAEDHAFGDGGDKAPDIIFAAKEGHGVAVGLGGVIHGLPAFPALLRGQGQGAVPGFAATFYGNKRGPIGAFTRRHDFHL
jgi:hypothetical protein